MNIRVTPFLVAGIALVAIPIGQLTAKGDSDVVAGLNASPVTLNLRGLNIALVGRGSYLVNAVANCSNCHTTGSRYVDGKNPFLGQTKEETTKDSNGAIIFLGGGRPFGAAISRNLTPDAAGLPGGLTLDQFMTIIRTGVDLKGLVPFTPSATHDLLQTMPWPQYQTMTDLDLRAIYEYLKAIPCVPGGPGLSASRCGS